MTRSFGFLKEEPGQHDALCGVNRDASEDLLAGSAALPDDTGFRLTRALPKFKNQADTNVCVPTAITNGAETRLRAIGVAVETGSVPQLYALSNQLIEAPGAPLRDVGTYGRTCMQAAADWGVARDADYPFRDPRTGAIDKARLVARLDKRPDVLQRASSWKLDEQLTIYARGPDRIRTIRAALVNLEPIPTAGVVDRAFMGYAGRGVIGAPNMLDQRGRHMVLIVDYRTNPTTKKIEFLIRNSWSSWGLVHLNQPSLAWVDENWIQAQEEMYRMRVSHGRRTS